MDKYERKAFFRYLETAKTDELQMKLVKLQSLLVRLSEPDAKAEADWLIKETQLEIDARKAIGD